MTDFLPPITNGAAWMWAGWFVVLAIAATVVAILERRDRKAAEARRRARNAHPTNPFFDNHRSNR